MYGLVELLWRTNRANPMFFVYFFPLIFVIAVIADWQQDKERKLEEKRREERKRQESL